MKFGSFDISSIFSHGNWLCMNLCATYTKLVTSPIWFAAPVARWSKEQNVKLPLKCFLFFIAYNFFNWPHIPKSISVNFSCPLWSTTAQIFWNFKSQCENPRLCKFSKVLTSWCSIMFAKLILSPWSLSVYFHRSRVSPACIIKISPDFLPTCKLKRHGNPSCFSVYWETSYHNYLFIT